MREGKRGGGRSEGAHACNGWSLEVTWRPVPAISGSITHIVGMMVHCQVVVAPWDPAPDEADELIVSSSLVMRFHLGSQQGGVGANEGEAGHDKRSGNIKANGDDVWTRGEKRQVGEAERKTCPGVVISISRGGSDANAGKVEVQFHGC